MKDAGIKPLLGSSCAVALSPGLSGCHGVLLWRASEEGRGRRGLGEAVPQTLPDRTADITRVFMTCCGETLPQRKQFSTFS